MTDLSELKGRLAAKKYRNSPAGAKECNAHVNPNGPEALEAITQLEGQLAEAVEALKRDTEVFALLLDTGSIKATSVLQAYTAARAAEQSNRTTLSRIQGEE